MKTKPANPAEPADQARLKHDLITEEGIIEATRGRHAIHCLTVVGTIEGIPSLPTTRKPPSTNM